MQIVIDIPEKTYNLIKEDSRFISDKRSEEKDVYLAIKNSIVSDTRFSQFNDDELQMMINALFDFGLDSLCFECVNEMKKRNK